MSIIELLANKHSISYYSLNEMGVNSIAFMKQDTLRILEYLKIEVIPVIGIDIYEMKDRKVFYSSNYDNWSCDRIENESLLDYVKRSHESAYKFVYNYNIACAIPLFDLTVLDIPNYIDCA